MAALAVRATAQVPQPPPPDTAPTRQQALDRALQELAEPPPVAAQQQQPQQQQSPLRLIDVSLVIDAAVGGSTATNNELKDLQGGGHDPRTRGFTLQQAELGLAGAVDPHLRGDARITAAIEPDDGTTTVELEEAYLTTLQLPANLQLKAGQFLTRFGRTNPQHPHAWDWLDQPIMNTRVFGGDGMRAPGAQVSWLLPTAGYAELFAAVQNASGETMRSFLASEQVYADDPVGGRLFAPTDVRSAGDLVYSLRLEATALEGDRGELVVGASAAFGPNATGPGGDTVLYGADFVWRWRPEHTERGWPFVKLEGEFLGRRFAADAQVDNSVPASPVALPATTLVDQGALLQVLWGFSLPWAAGVRVEYATGNGDSYDQSSQTFARRDDPLRADRWRVAPLLAYHPSEFSRLRLQYDYDDSDALASPAHSVWLGFEILIGAHPAHSY